MLVIPYIVKKKGTFRLPGYDQKSKSYPMECRDLVMMVGKCPVISYFLHFLIFLYLNLQR